MVDRDLSLRIVAAARGRRIRTMMTGGGPADFDGAEISIGVFDLERFLDIVAPPPPEDDIAGRIMGRGQDMTVGDEPWEFDLVPGYGDAGFQFHALVRIPRPDVAEVLAKLEGGAGAQDAFPPR